MKTSAQPLAATRAPSQPSNSLAQADQRPAVTLQRQLQADIAASPRQVAQRQAQNDLTASPRQAAQSSLPLNRTGLPDQLKAGVEALSGHSLNDVHVHYNSAQPAALQAHAYAQGTDIHLAPGQEKHLPHEAWHVAQQKQGRVRSTTQLKGVGLNDDAGLEQEADHMGARALALPALGPPVQARRQNPAQRPAGVVQAQAHATDCGCASCNVVQRVVIEKKNSKNKILDSVDTDTASLVRLKQALTWPGLSAVQKALITNTINRLENPFLGASSADVTPTDAMRDRTLEPGKRSEKMGQIFNTVSGGNIPKGSNELTSTKEKQKFKSKFYTKGRTNGRVATAPMLVGDVVKEVAHIVCPYCSRTTPLEATDQDHVVATEAMRAHLLSEARKMNSDPDYTKRMKQWLKAENLVYDDWFVGAQNSIEPTALAMKGMHNTAGNLLLSCKTCNQTEKNAKSMKAYLLGNKWFGPDFLQKHSPLEANIGLTDRQGKPMGEAILEHQDRELGALRKELFDILRAQSLLTLRSQKHARAKTSSKKQQWRIDSSTLIATHDSDDDTSEDELVTRFKAPASTTDALHEGLYSQISKKHGVPMVPLHVLKEADKQLHQEKKEKRKLRKEVKQGKATIAERDREIAELKKSLAQLKQATGQPASQPQKRKRTDSPPVSPLPSPRPPAKKSKSSSVSGGPQSSGSASSVPTTTFSGFAPSTMGVTSSPVPRQLELQRQLDVQSSEPYGTHAKRIGSLSQAASVDSFIAAYELHASRAWKSRHFAHSSWQQYKKQNIKWWQTMENLLQQYYLAGK